MESIKAYTDELQCEFCRTALTFVEGVELPEEKTNLGETFLCKQCFKWYQENPNDYAATLGMIPV